ncbi:hypothetical protein CLNEO_09140 [Anaerotignum neopropionicum]|uniref:DUF4391 domain-containing protein n=1 Tax=Anaerotignum neopropionicum TaxID=36847 RepID=A0A136WGK5_9FIRM|nr:DUF4391 domain-containing protein [Anaerotignum neopropionicum]KXL53688.1 hypothetical protein CLNEO_09140 [Anaerotignum neopropionicum]
MFGIPDRCAVNQFIAKKNFLSFGNLNKVEREVLSSNVRKITLSFQLEPSNSNVPAYKDDIREYPLINIFNVDVTLDANTKRITDFIMSAIPYPSIIIFQTEEQMQLAVCHQRTNLNDSLKNVLEEVIITDWLPFSEMLFDLNEMNLRNCYTLYCDIVDFVSIQNAKKITRVEIISGEQARQLLHKAEALEAKITALRAQLKKETQFNRKVELNMEIKRLEKEKATI